MDILKKLFGKKRNQEGQQDAEPNKNEQNTVQDDVWDSSLEQIPYEEEIRYKIFKRWGELKSGDSFGLEDVFGSEGVSAEEYMEFLKVMIKLQDPVPMFNTLEELQEAESNVKDDDADMMFKIANTLQFSYSALADANRWYMKAANLGHSDAITRLAGAYIHGWGIEHNTHKAIQLYKKAIETDGNRDSLLDLGLCYLQGDGVQPDIDKGFFLMERSAKQGNMLAQYNMGFLYRTGQGVEANMEEALRWYHLSAAQGYYQALDYLDKYEEEKR